jgi:lysine-N-methylase
MLSATCATYPRAVSTQAGQVERALNLSCPEAARVTLLDPNLLGDLAPRPSATGAERYAAVRYHAGQPLAGYDPRLAIREFVLLLLGDRGYPLWQRLYLLGTLSRRLETLSGTLNPSRSARPTIAAWCAANPATVARMLADSSRSTAHGGLREVMAEIVPNPGKQLQLVAELLRLRLNEAPVPERFLACLEDFELGLGLARAANETEILAAYTEAERRFYRPLMARHPYLLENYLMNYVFKNGYPFGRPEQTSYRAADVEGEHLALCVHAALVQTLAIGMAGRYREAFDTGHVVRLVQSLARAIEHSTIFPGQIAEFVRAHSLRTPQGIALLLMPPA